MTKEIEVIDQYNGRHRFPAEGHYYEWRLKPGTIGTEGNGFLDVFRRCEGSEGEYEIAATFPNPSRVGTVTDTTALTLPLRELSMEQCPRCGFAKAADDIVDGQEGAGSACEGKLRAAKVPRLNRWWDAQMDDKEINDLLHRLNADAWARGPYGPAPAPFERDRAPWDAKTTINMLRAERDALRGEIDRLRTRRDCRSCAVCQGRSLCPCPAGA